MPAKNEKDVLLKVRNLSVRLEGQTILQDLSFDVWDGETLMILGPNGAGKTMLVRALLGLLPHDGEVVWRPGITKGYVPQRIPFQREMPVTVEEFFRLKGIGRDETRESVRQVGLVDKSFLKQRIGRISSGQFQRVLIAWALVGRPDVLLFDEPTAGIDVGGEETVYSLLQKIQSESGLTVLLITHDLSAVYQQATSVLCLNHQIICHGPPTEILTPETLKQVFGEERKFFVHAHG